MGLYTNIKKKWKKYFEIFFGNILPTLVNADRIENLEKCDILFFRHDYHCSYNFKNKAYAPLVDSLIQMCKKRELRCHVIANPYSQLVGPNAFNNPIPINRVWFKIVVMEFIYRLAFGKKKSIEWANNKRVEVWDRILKKSNPRIVIGIQPHRSLNTACSSNSIPVYDLQHGIIVNIDKWYGERFWSDTSVEELPSGYLCWDESSARVLREWAPQKGIEVNIIGNPWFTRFIEPKAGDTLVQKAIVNGKVLMSDLPTVLLTLQWGLDRFSKERELNYVMIEELEQVIRETAGTYRWLIRMHPLQVKGKKGRGGVGVKSYLDRIFGHLPTVEFDIASKMALPVLLKHVDLHITEFSSTVIEAGWYGIKSGLVNEFIAPGKPREDYYKYERSLGLADVLPHESDSIKRWINETIDIQFQATTFVNSRERFSQFLDRFFTK